AGWIELRRISIGNTEIDVVAIPDLLRETEQLLGRVVPREISFADELGDTVSAALQHLEPIDLLDAALHSGFVVVGRDLQARRDLRRKDEPQRLGDRALDAERRITSGERLCEIVHLPVVRVPA